MTDTDATPLLVLGAGALTILGELSRGETPRPAVFIGTAAAGLGIMFAAMGAPGPAHGLALVVFLTALLTSGYDVAQGVNRALSRNGPT